MNAISGTEKVQNMKQKSYGINPESFRTTRNCSLSPNDYTQILESHLTLSDRISPIEETVTLIHYFPMGWTELPRGFRNSIVTGNNSRKVLRIERVKSHYQ